jgi:hypothetical protein
LKKTLSFRCTGPEQAVTETGVSVKDLVETGGAALMTGYTALPTTEVEVETAAQQARESRAAELQRQPLVATTEAEPESLRPTQAGAGRTGEGFGGDGGGGGGGGGGTNRSSIGFEMDDKTAEALGFSTTITPS